MAQIAAHHEVHRNQVTSWKSQLLQNAAAIFGAEAMGKALDQWAYERGIALRLIQAGKPTQNAHVESFNGKFRDKCLNEHWFRSLPEAGAIVAAWRMDYNQSRPHSTLEYRENRTDTALIVENPERVIGLLKQCVRPCAVSGFGWNATEHDFARRTCT